MNPSKNGLISGEICRLGEQVKTAASFHPAIMLIFRRQFAGVAVKTQLKVMPPKTVDFVNNIAIMLWQ